MKIKRLKIAGFGPYKNTQWIDFEKFDSDGIFLITGKTGAGKSSILDAICFALYGSVPRYEGTESQLRSDHCEPDDPTFVELEFSLNEADYRIYRTPRFERAKKRGGGTTTAQPDARLDVLDQDGWRSIATRQVDVGQELSRILPLKQDQFLQVILLAQNRFQRFLLANTEDRRSVLRTLFGTARFERLGTGLIARRKTLDDELVAVQQTLAGFAATAGRQLEREDVPQYPDLGWFDAAQLELEHQLGTATEQADAADGAFIAATNEFQALDDLRKRQDRRDGAATRLAALTGRQESIQAERVALHAANRAARVWPQARARQETDVALTAAVADETAARQAWQGFRAETAEPETNEALGGGIDDLLGQLGSLGDVLTAERLVAGLDTEIAALLGRLAKRTAALEKVQQRLEGLPQRLDALDLKLAEAGLAAARQDEALAQLERADAAKSAAQEVRRLYENLAEAHRADTVAARENTSSAARYQALVDQRLAGHAFELASQLVEGEPCAVCGSTAHPAPITSDSEPVSEGDIEAARETMTTCREALDETHAVVQNVNTRLTEARTRADNKSVELLESELEAANVALTAARSAAAREASLGQEKGNLRAELDKAQTDLAAAQVARYDVATRLTDRRSHRESITKRVSAHRGAFDSVTDRVQRLQAELDAARRLHDALERSRDRLGVRDTAVAVVATQLAKEGFDDESAVAAARISDAEMRPREADVRTFDGEVAAACAVLAESDLADLPAETVDVASAGATLDSTSVARDNALSTRSSLGERVTLITRLVTDARVQLAASTELLATQSQVRELAAVVHGDEPNTKRMRLETYVLAAQLEEIIASANNRLRTMTGGRYALEHDDSLQYRGTQSGLGLAIRDEHTGRARPTHSLSGGETFLASLALALGLAEVVSNQAGGVALDTLFVDEGFGSLDSETLETAMSTLDSLRAGGRTIGLISHVDSMREQIPAKLGIIVTDQGHSKIEESYAPA